jgi:SnoaL-like domain
VNEENGEAQRPAVQVVAEAMACYERGELDVLADLVHPDAEIEMIALGGGAAHGPDGLVEALTHAREGVHRPTVQSIRAIGADAALLIGRIQFADARGGLSDRKAVWLSVLRDGLIWRTRVFESEPEARAYYATLVEELRSDAR